VEGSGTGSLSLHTVAVSNAATSPLPDSVPLNEATIYGRHRKQLMELTSNQDISNNLESLRLYRTKCQSEAQNETPAFKKLWAALDNPDTVALKIPSLLRKLF
jgi:hypothetical protein